jgi:hypothetical protein
VIVSFFTFPSLANSFVAVDCEGSMVRSSLRWTLRFHSQKLKLTSGVCLAFPLLATNPPRPHKGPV